MDPERDNISIDGRPIPKDVEKIYIALNKPSGWVTTREDPHAENIVMDLVRGPLEARLGRGNPSVEGLHPVGRLDTQTEGLLLLTNDGDFTQALTHPRHGVEKVYLAEVRGIPDPEAIEKLRAGVPLFGRWTLPARVKVRRVDRARGVCSVEIGLKEGRNQQIRRMLQAVGYPVTRLKRVSIGTVNVERLKPKQWRFLTEAEVKMLMDAARAGIASGAGEATPRPRTRPRTPASRGHGPRPETPPRGGKPSGSAIYGASGGGRPSGPGRPADQGRPSGTGRPAGQGRPSGTERPAGANRFQQGGTPDQRDERRPAGPRPPRGTGQAGAAGTGGRPTGPHPKAGPGPEGRTRTRRLGDSKNRRPSRADRELRKKY